MTASVDRAALVRNIAETIVEAVNLRHKNVDEITAETALMETGLELDSLDMLEVVVAVENRFGVKVADADEGKRVFRTIGTIAAFVEAKDA